MSQSLPLKISKKSRSHKDDSSLRIEKKKRKRDHLEEASPSKKRREKTSQSSHTTKTTHKSIDTVDNSILFLRRSSLYLPLAPIAQQNAIDGLCAEHLSPLILSYYPAFHAIILAYSNVKLCNSPDREPDATEKIVAKAIDEYAATHVWVTADFLLFRPRPGATMQGWVNIQNEEHLGLVCWNLFNASISRKMLPRKWKWVPGGEKTATEKPNGDESMEGDAKEKDLEDEDEGHFVDSKGKKVEGLLTFRISDVEAAPSSVREKGFLSIEGTLLSEEEEKELFDRERTRLRERARSLKVHEA